MDRDSKCVAPGAVREQLRRILDSHDFDASERNGNFLAYVVEEALEGRSARIKAYTIATTVFRRDASFDPQLDSIVRIEAGRIRRALGHYYLTAGAKDLILITLPRGSYVPVFEVTASPGTVHAPPVAPARSNRCPGCTILVAAFEEDGGQSPFPNFARGFSRQMTVALTRFADLSVLAVDGRFEPESDVTSGEYLAKLGVDFLLTGGTAVSAESFSIEVMLMEARTRRYVWAEHFHGKLTPSEILKVRDEVANSIARTLAQPYGIIFSNKAREADGRPPEFLDSYDYVIRFYQYCRTFDRNVFESVRTGLERAVLMDPGYADGFACLSQIYSDAFRFRYALPDPGIDPGQRALLLAHRSIQLAPNSSRGYHALGHAYWFSGDVGGALAAFVAGLTLNPNDTDLMADLGLRYANLGRWQEAVPLLEGSYARNLAQPGTYRVGLAQYHYVHGRYGDALVEARKINAPSVLYGFVLIAAAAAQLGLHPEAREALRSLLAQDPHFGDHIVTDLTLRHIHRDTIGAVLDGLRKAGLMGREMGAAAGARPVQVRLAE
jgi:TolB-like protein